MCKEYNIYIYMLRTLFLQTQRTAWVLQWPGQIVIAGCQTYWTTDVEQAIRNGDLAGYYKVLLKQVGFLNRELCFKKPISIT